MAEFCNTYADKMGSPPDFDVYAIHSSLRRDHYYAILCEGCGLVAIAKESNGDLRVGYPNGEFIDWRPYWGFDDLV